MVRKVIWVLVWTALMLPGLALAHTEADPISIWPTGYWESIFEGVCGNSGICTSICDLIHLIQHVVYWALSFLIFIVVPITLVWGGIRILTAAGSADKLETGKKIITGAIIGALLGLGAFLIINFFFIILGVGDVTWSTIECSLP